VSAAEPEDDEAVRDVLGDVAALSRSVGFRVPEAELTCVVGIGARLFDRPFPGPRPAELQEFRELVGKEHPAVSTPGGRYASA
jgi:putative iron-dependent peroxidase